MRDFTKDITTLLTLGLLLSGVAAAQTMTTEVEVLDGHFFPVQSAVVVYDQGLDVFQGTTSVDGLTSLEGVNQGASSELRIGGAATIGGWTIEQAHSFDAYDPASHGLDPADPTYELLSFSVPRATTHAFNSPSVTAPLDEITWEFGPLDQNSQFAFTSLVATLNDPERIEAYLQYHQVNIPGAGTHQRGVLFRSAGPDIGGSGAVFGEFLQGSAAWLANGGLDLTIIHITRNASASGSCTLSGSYIDHNEERALHSLHGSFGVGDTILLYSAGNGDVLGPFEFASAAIVTGATAGASAAGGQQGQGSCSGLPCITCDEEQVDPSALVCAWDATQGDSNCPAASWGPMTSPQVTCRPLFELCWTTLPAEPTVVNEGRKWGYNLNINWTVNTPGGSLDVEYGEYEAGEISRKLTGANPGLGANGCGQCEAWVMKALVQIRIRNIPKHPWWEFTSVCRTRHIRQICRFDFPMTYTVCDKK